MNEGQIEQLNIPHLFRCPISLDLFQDPVTLSTGQTYERSSIEKWFSSGNLTCPVTMQKLHDPSIVPNHTLRHLINHWLQLGPQFDNSATFDYLASLKHTLESHESNLQTKKLALEKIIVLSDEFCSFKKSCFLELNFLPLLLELVFGFGIGIPHDRKGPAPVQEDSSLREDKWKGHCTQLYSCLCDEVVSRFEPLTNLSLESNCYGCAKSRPQNGQLSRNHMEMEFIEVGLSCIVKLLPLVGLEPLNMLKHESKLQNFLILFEEGTILVKINLCHVIDSTASPQTEEVCYMLGNSQKLVQEIVLLIVTQNCDCEISKAAIKAMSALSSLQSNRESLVKGGAIDGIITYISDSEKKDNKNLAPLGMGILKKLLVLESAKEKLVNHPNGIETLVKKVFRVSNQECSEISVGILLIICRDFGSAREDAIGKGILTQLLFLLQSQCGNKTKAKARMLLKLLRSKWMEEPNHV